MNVKEKVVKLRTELTEAMNRIAEQNGFTLKLGVFRYDEFEVSFRTVFIANEKKMARANMLGALSGLTIGDKVRHPMRPEEAFEILDFKRSGNAEGRRLSDGHVFLLKNMKTWEKVGTTNQA